MSSFDAPIYAGEQIFGNLKQSNGTCPARTDICNNLHNGTFVIENSISIPKCSDIRFTNDMNESPNGCCAVDEVNETCDKYFTPDVNKYEAKYYDMGIDITDSSGLNPRSVCHSAPIRKRNLVISDVIVIIIVSAIIVIITAFVGACYEFMFKYGECKDCIYYKTDCSNRKRLSIIDYMFPTDICSYPYQECNKNSDKSGDSLVGGGPNTKTGFISTYAEYTENGTKCITIHDEVALTSKPFPYNLIDYANNNIKYEFTRMPYKAFALFFLYTALLSRILISNVLRRLSIKYQQIIKHNSILSNIMFLFFTGIFFNVIANYTGIHELNGANGYILYFLIMLLSFSFSISVIATILFLWCYPPIMFEKYYRQCNIPSNYYKLINYKKIFYCFYEYKEKKPLYKKILFIFADLLLLLPIFLMFMFSVGIGLFASTLAFFWMIITLLINLFYVPLYNIVEFLDIIKNHGNLLTILFCITVLMASINRLNNVTTGVLGVLMGLIILYTVIKNVN